MHIKLNPAAFFTSEHVSGSDFRKLVYGAEAIYSINQINPYAGGG